MSGIWRSGKIMTSEQVFSADEGQRSADKFDVSRYLKEMKLLPMVILLILAMANQVSLKISYQNELRRLTVADDTNFETLKDVVHRLFPLLPIDQIVIKYEDDENDLVTV